MRSPTVTRVWRVTKASRNEFPLPELGPSVTYADGAVHPGAPLDDVMQYLIREAVYFRVLEEDRAAEEKAEKDAKMNEWKKGRPGDGAPGSL